MAEHECLQACGLPAEPVPAAYDRVASEILRRDGNAEWREWRAYRVAGAVSLACIILALGMGWFAMRSARVEVVVQVVQPDEAGRMVKIGVPKDLLEYEPEEGPWRTMLTEWVNKRHWRGEEDEPFVRARYDWRWLYLHTCGTARKQLAEAEKQDKPFTKRTARTQVDVESITKTVTPNTYQVLWKATTVERYNPKPQEVWWTSTFTVGRVMPKTVSDANLNQLGLCVTGFDDDQRH